MGNIKLVMFDMDGTILQGRTIFEFAEKKGFLEELNRIIKGDKEFYKKTIEIAHRLKGMKKNELLDIFREIPLQKNAEKVFEELKKKNIITAIATDSYQFVADDIKNRLNIDYAFANNLIIEEGIVTGNIELHNKELREEFVEHKVYSICKSCVLDKLCLDLKIKPSNTIAIGDGIVDICMIERAGIGIAFNASEKVQKHADIVTDDLGVILDCI